MNYLETIGFTFIAFTSVLGVAALVYSVAIGASITKRQCQRGNIEEMMSIQHELDLRKLVDGIPK